MNGMNDPRGPEWLEGALSAWALEQPLSEVRLDAIAETAAREMTPELSFEWWRTIFPILRMPKVA